MNERIPRIHVNKAYSPLYNTDYRFYILKGGAGSGKSYAMAQKVIASAMSDKSRRWLIVRKTAASIEKSVYQELIDQIEDFGATDKFTYNITKHTIICKLTKVRIMCVGIDDPEKIKSVKGITDCWIEEASELKKDDMMQLRIRLRGKGIRRHYYLTFNPISEKHFLKSMFFDNIMDDTLIIQTTYKDNIKNLEQEDIDELESFKNTDPEYYKVYVLNEWGNSSTGKVFHNYVLHDFDYESDLVNRAICAGIDFGYNDPHALTLSYVKDQELYIYFEYNRTKQTPDKLADSLRDIPGLNRLNLYCEHDPGTYTILQRNGLPRARPAYKCEIMFGIMYLKHFKKIHIHKTNCPNTAFEFENYTFKIDKDGTVLDKDPVDKDNHHIDSLRYGHSYEIKKWKQMVRK